VRYLAREIEERSDDNSLWAGIVGVALRGHPSWDSLNLEGIVYRNHGRPRRAAPTIMITPQVVWFAPPGRYRVSQPRAATEGRPYDHDHAASRVVRSA